MKNYANGKGQYESLKPAFQCFCGEEEWEEHSPGCTHSLWCRLAKLPARCCHDWYPWIKNVRIRVVQAVGFQSRGLRWYSHVQPGFCGLHVAALCSHQVSFLTMSLMQDGLWCCLSRDLFGLEFLGFCFPPLQCMLPTRKALKLLSAKSLCCLLSPVAMLILVNNLCQVCVSLGFSYSLAAHLLRQYTGLKAKLMAAFPERVEIQENM